MGLQRGRCGWRHRGGHCQGLVLEGARMGTRGGKMGMNAKELPNQASVWSRRGLNALGGCRMKVKTGKLYVLRCQGRFAVRLTTTPSKLKTPPLPSASYLPLLPPAATLPLSTLLSSTSWRKVFTFLKLLPFCVRLPPNTTKMDMKGKMDKTDTQTCKLKD